MSTVYQTYSTETNDVSSSQFVTANNAKKPGIGNLMAAIAEIQMVLSELEGAYSQMESEVENGQLQIGDVVADAMQTDYENKVADEQKNIKDGKRNRILHAFLTAFEVIAAVVVSIAGVISGNPELAVAMIVLTILTVSGAMGKLTDAIGKGITKKLEEDGVNSKTAEKLGNLIASVIVTAVTIIATLGVGAIGGAIDAATEAGEEIAEEAADETSSTTGKILDGVKNMKKTALFAGVQAGVGTNLIENIFATAASNGSSKVQEAMQIIGEVIQAIMAILATLGGGASSAGESAENAESLLEKVTNQSEKLTQAMNKLKGFASSLTENLSEVNKADILLWTTRIKSASQLLPAGPEVGTGVIQIKQGDLEATLSTLTAELTKLSNVLEINQDSTSGLQKQAQSTLKTFGGDVQLVSQSTSEFAAIANVLSAF
ncbi:hypothetical protein [Simkania sp.]|uniref:hypothetical protein n=1 Tax=Simkania sp. TaxID=34094 RepID=UPI003B5156F5